HRPVADTDLSPGSLRPICEESEARQRPDICDRMARVRCCPVDCRPHRRITAGGRVMSAPPPLQTRQSPAATGLWDRTSNTSGLHFTTDPFELVLSRLEGVQRHGDDSARAYSPLGNKTSRSLSIGRGANSTVVMHDFAGHST